MRGNRMGERKRRGKERNRRRSNKQSLDTVRSER